MENSSLEKSILEQIAEVDRRIADLNEERRVLTRLLLRTRSLSSATQDVTRRNSANRLIIEGRILELLATSQRPMAAYTIYKELRFLEPKLKEATFRSYMHRLKERGVIRTQSRGHWSKV